MEDPTSRYTTPDAAATPATPATPPPSGEAPGTPTPEQAAGTPPPGTPPPVTPPPVTPPPGPAPGPTPATPPPPPAQPAWRPPPADHGRTASLVFGVIILLVGLWFFGSRTLGLDMPDIEWGTLWPLLLIGLGAWIVYGAIRRTR
jgi:hypothetical protein